MSDFNVALWLKPLEHINIAYCTEIVSAPDPFQAVLIVMHTHGLTKVAYAAAHFVGTTNIRRFHKVVLYVDDRGDLKGECL